MSTMSTSWFERAVRAQGVAEDLRRAVPELAGGGRELLGCEMIRLRAGEPEGYWTATYLFEVTGTDGTVDTVAAHGTLIPPDAEVPDVASSVPFGSDGWSCWLSEDRLLLETWSSDDALPALAILTDPTSAREAMEAVLRASSPERSDLRLAACRATVASYKPGVRVTLCCDLDYETAGRPASGPRTVVAKAHTGAGGAAVHAAQRALWDSPLATSTMVAIAEPYGYVDELGLSVQAYLEHDRTLKDLLAATFGSGGQVTDESPGGLLDEAAAAMRATARAVAAVHTSGVSHGDESTWEEELATQCRKLDKLAAAVPWLLELTADAPERLAVAGEASAADPLVACHGSFRTAQVLLRDGPVGIIDFDKVGLAEPGADIGPFLSKLHHTAVNKGGTELPDEAGAAAIGRRVDRLREEFLAAYREDAALSAARLACWEGLEYLSLVVGSAKKGLRERAGSCAGMLRRHLEAAGM